MHPYKDAIDGSTDSAGVRIPPPVLQLVWLLLGFGLEELRSFPLGSEPGIGLAGYVLVATGVLLIFAAAREFRRVQTNIRPDRPTSTIIQTGPYSFTRNPFYVAFIIVHLGIGLIIASWWILATAFPAALTLRCYAIAREESYLARKFDVEYPAYTERVRRWL